MWLKKERGQAMVEFALVLPLLLLLVCAIIDFGWIYCNQLVINNASREAARYTAVHFEGASIDAADRTAAQNIVQSSSPTLTSPTVTLAYNAADRSVKVTVSADVPVLTGVSSTFFGGSTVTLSAVSVMKAEG
jgi:Flp pilus assembly protein TadG